MTVRTFFRKYIWALLWAGFILFACGAQPGTLTELHLSDLFSFDKPIHAFLFGTQAWLLIRGTPAEMRTLRLVTAACLTAAAYGVLIEVLQISVFKGRSYDYFDMTANATGALVAWVWHSRKVRALTARSRG